MNVSTATRRASSGRRHVVLTLADQIVSSGTNFVVGVLVARAAGAEVFGTYSIAFLVWVAAFGVNRALVTDPMTVEGGDHGTGVDGRQHRAVQAGTAATLLLGLGWSGLLAALGATSTLLGWNGAALLALAPWMPGLLLQDYWRATSFRLWLPGRALTNDLLFGLVQGCALLMVWVTGTTQVAAFVAAWGVGAGAGAVLGLRSFRVRLTLRGGMIQLRALWTRSRLFLGEYGTAFTSDQGYLLLVPALLGMTLFGTYRAGFSLIGPVIIVFMAGSNIGLPGCVRELSRRGVPGLDRYTLRLTTGVVALTTGYCVIVAVFAEPLLRLTYGPRFVEGAIVTQLVAAQYVIFSAGLACGLSLKALGRVGHVWAVRVAGAVVSTIAVCVLASSFGVVGAASSGVAAAVTYSAGLVVLYRRMRGRDEREPVRLHRGSAGRHRATARPSAEGVGS